MNSGSREGWTGSSGTILIADDEPLVLSVLRAVLANRGYTVLAARSAREALAIFEARTAPIHLLIADVVMPGMTGPELADKLLESQPDLRVLFIAGMPESEHIRRRVLDRGFELLAKPFLPRELAERVGKLLSEPGHRAASRA